MILARRWILDELEVVFWLPLVVILGDSGPLAATDVKTRW